MERNAIDPSCTSSTSWFENDYSIIHTWMASRCRPDPESGSTGSSSLRACVNYGIYVNGNAVGTTTYAIVAVADSAISDNNVGIWLTSNGNPHQSAHVHLQHNMVTANGVGLDVESYGRADVDGNYMYDDILNDIVIGPLGFILTLQNNTVGSSTNAGAILTSTPF